jgi:hypothetical protein
MDPGRWTGAARLRALDAPGLDRRGFLGAIATALVAPVAPRRVYSFLWDNPLVAPASELLGFMKAYERALEEYGVFMKFEDYGVFP